MKPRSLFLFVLLDSVLLFATTGCSASPTVSSSSVSSSSVSSSSVSSSSTSSSSTSSSSSSSQSSQETVATPTFSPSEGTYSNSQIVYLLCATPEADIYYTLDGSTPTSSSTLFASQGIHISTSTTIKAIAIESGMLNSQVASATYTLLPLTWTEGSTTVTITGVVGNPANLVIPSTINGKSVKHIGQGAFTNCTGLTNIVIPDSVTSIEDRAFKNCTGLTNIVIPDSITSIGYSMFYGCSNLINVSLPSHLTSIKQDSFEICVNLTNIVIPDSVTFIGNNAFSKCTGLTNIVLPMSLTNIGNMAFYYCLNLTNITIEATNPPSLGNTSFNNNAQGRKIYVPSGLVSNYQSTGNWTNYASDITNY